MIDNDNEIKDYLIKQEKSGFKIGDKVKIIRKAESREDGWNNSWHDEMDRFVDNIMTIRGVTDVGINFNESSLSFPYFILEKVKSYKDGVKDGIRMYSWMKDGTSYVGTTGKTLKSALDEIDKEID